MKNLKELSKVEYEVLKSSGSLFFIYPEASGNFEQDCIKSFDNEIGKEYSNDIEK
jgi:hypothetical protein